MRSLEGTFHDCAGKVEAVVVADAGCRGANPIASYGIASAPRSTAAAQRRRSALYAGVTGRRQGKDIVNQRVIGSAAALDS
jgi:hypothetical protein